MSEISLLKRLRVLVDDHSKGESRPERQDRLWSIIRTLVAHHCPPDLKDTPRRLFLGVVPRAASDKDSGKLNVQRCRKIAYEAGLSWWRVLSPRLDSCVSPPLRTAVEHSCGEETNWQQIGNNIGDFNPT
jgi:hypothetical protein